MRAYFKSHKMAQDVGVAYTKRTGKHHAIFKTLVPLQAKGWLLYWEGR